MAPTTSSNSFLAACGPNLFTVTSLSSSDHALVEPLWVTDHDVPSFEHENISAIAQVHHQTYMGDYSLRGCLVVLMGSRLCISSPYRKSGHAVPRSVIAHPDQKPAYTARMIYSERLAHFVLATREIEQRPDTPGSARHSRSVIEYRPPPKAEVSLVDDQGSYTSGQSIVQALLQAGERVLALSEWVYHNAEKKKYVFTLVGTEIVSGSERDTPRSRGRIHILQPTVRKGRVDNVLFSITMKFDEPVQCIAMLKDIVLVCGHGSIVSCHVYSASLRKWRMCVSIHVTSPAVSIIVDGQFAHVTTSADSLMTFKLVFRPPETVEFALVSVDSCHAICSHHITIPSVLKSLQPASDASSRWSVNLVTTKTADVHGLVTLANPDSPTVSPPLQAHRLFSARLGHAIIRLRAIDVSLNPIVKVNSVVGISTDGTLYGLSLLEASDWARLKFIETLIRRNPETFDLSTFDMSVYPHVNQEERIPLGLKGLDPYDGESRPDHQARTGFDHMSADDEDADDDAMQGVESHGPPSGSGWAALPFVPRGSRLRDDDMHVDGDVLALLVRGPDPAGTLRRILERERGKVDRVGGLTHRHFEQETALVPEAVELARRALLRWGFW